MAEIYDMGVRLKLDLPSAEVSKMKNLVSNIGSLLISKNSVAGLASSSSRMGAALGLGVAAAGIGALVVSSPMLQNTLKKLLDAVMMLIRPIGDILSIGLRPVIDILKPIGMFFRILMQPYIQKANEAMRLGRGFLAIGEEGKAMEAYGLGVQLILKPFFDMIVTGSVIMIQGILEGIELLGGELLDLLGIFIGLENASEGFRKLMDKAQIDIGLAGASLTLETNTGLSNMVDELKIQYDNMKTTTQTSMETVNKVMGEEFVKILENTTTFFAPQFKDEIEFMFDDILDKARKTGIEVNSALNSGVSTTTDDSGRVWQTSTSTVTTTTKRGGGGGALEAR